MEQDASLRRYRDAFRAHPELNVRTPAGSANETILAGGMPPDAEAAPHQSPFPPHLEILEKIAETNLSTTWKVMDHERKSPVVLKEPRAHLLVDAEPLSDSDERCTSRPSSATPTSCRSWRRTWPSRRCSSPCR